MKTCLITLLAVLIWVPAYAQNPTYNMVLKNDSLVSPTAYEFDIFLERTGVTEFQLAQVQPIMTFNTAISAGTLTLSMNGGSSQLNASQQPTTMSVTGNELLINPRVPPGAGSGTVIPVAPGLRVGRFRLTSTVAFSNQQANIIWKNNTNPFSKVFAYNIADVNVEITDSTGHLNSLLNASLSPPSITTASPLPPATAGVAYLDTLKASGGTAPYTWTRTSGSIPPGMTFPTSGILGGTSNTAGTYVFTARVTDNTLAFTEKSISITVNPNTVSQLEFVQQPVSTVAGVFITPPVSVRLKDNYGNNISTAGVAVTMALTSGNGVLTGSLIETTNGSGTATFDSLRIDRKGDKIITASSSVTASRASNLFAITSATPTQVRVETASDGSGAIVAAQNLTAGSALTMYAISRDAFDNFIENVAANAWSLQGVTGSIVNGDLIPAADSRSATFTGHATGTAQVRATSPPLTPVNSGTITVIPGPAKKLVFIQQPQATAANAVLVPPVTVQVRDSLNNNIAVENVSVGMALTSGTGTLFGTSPRLTNASGLATFSDLRVDSPGVKILTASSTGLTSAVSNGFTLSTYTITASAGPNGTITPSGTISLIQGANQTFTITPNTGFHVAGVLVDGSPVGPLPSYTFTNVTANHTISASFAADTVQVTVQTSPPGRTIRVDGGGALTAPQTFNWVYGSTHTIATDSAQTGAAGVRYFYSSWSDAGALSHTVTPTSSTTYTARFNTQYFLTMSAGTGGTVSPVSAWRDSGQVVSISATADPGYSFSGWAGTGTGSFSGVSNPADITMNGPITQAGSFTANPISVTVTTSPAGRQITVDGTTYTSPQVFNWTATQSHTIATDSVQGGAAGVRYVYAGWSDAGAISHTVTPLANGTYTAGFGTQYYLTMTPGSGGTTTPPSDWKNSGQVVSIGATPNTGYTFSGWTGTGSGSFTGSTNPVNITMNGPVTQVAAFTPNAISVTVTTDPVGQQINVDGTNYTSPHVFNWFADQPHTIATDSIQPGGTGARTVWASWSDAGARSHIVAPLTNTTYTASFTTQYYLTMNANAGGTVTPASNWINAGQSVVIEGIPNTGYVFSSWSGIGTGSYTGGSNPRSITVNGPITQTANFVRPAVQVTIQTSPPGRTFRVDNGTLQTNTYTFSFDPEDTHDLSTDSIQAQINGISRFLWTSWSDGGTKDHTILYPGKDTTIILNFKRQFYLTMNAATGGNTLPAPNWFDSAQVVGISATATTGYTFSGWTGSGTGSYTGPNNPGSVIMNGAITETPNFTLAPINVTIQTSPAGRTFLVDGSQYTAPQTFVWSATAPHTIAAVTPQGDTATRYLYSTWSDGGSQSHTVTPNRDTTFTVSYSTQHYLTVTAGPNGSVAPASGWQNAGSSVQISATPDPGYNFASWTGTGAGSYTGTNNPATVTMNGPVGETASFSAGTIPITVTTDPAGLAITVDGTSYTSPQSFNWTTGSSHSISTDSLQNSVSPGIRYRWTSWSDAGARTHTVSPGSPATYTATFGTQYLLTMQANPGGTVTPSTGWFDAFSSVLLTATPNTGYGFVSWSGTGVGAYSGGSNPRSITIGGPITQTANFSQLPVQVTIITNPPNLTFRVDGSSLITNLYTFSFGPSETHTVTTDSIQSQTSTSRYVWTNWSDGGARSHTLLFPGKDTTIVVNFKRQFNLTMNAATGGTVSPPTGWFDSAQVVGISATPTTGYTFSGWTGSGPGAYNGPSNPASVTMNGAITETAGFTLAPINVTVRTSPAGRTFLVDGTQYTGSQAFVWSASEVHSLSTTSPQGDTATRYLYAGWSDGGAQTHSVSPLTDSVFTVNFSTQYYLTMDSGLGGGTVAPANNWYNAGQAVQISATPYTGYNFGSWAGTGTGSYTGTSNPATVAMNAPVRETATFTAGTIPITVTTVPPGRSVSVDGTLYTSPQTFNWTTGSVHTIGVDSIQNSVVTGTRYRFTGWSDAGALSHVVSPTVATTFTATFGTQYLLTMQANPGGSVDPPTGWYDAGSSITLNGIADPGYSFSTWSGSGSGSYSGSTNPRIISVNGPITQIANFVQNPYQVIVQTVPAGRQYRVGGTTYTTQQTFSVTPGNALSLSIPTNPQGGPAGTQYAWNSWSDSGTIAHSFTPASDTTITAYFTTQYYLTMNAGSGGSVSPPSGWFDSGSEVGITATPGGGYTFSGWAGTGTGSYSGLNNPASVTMNAPVTETANFTLFPIQVRLRSNPPGRTVFVDTVSYITPQDLIWTSGETHTISGDSIQDGATGVRYLWTAWSDGKARSHSVTGLSDTTFTINYRPQYFLTMIAGTGGSATPASAWHDSAASVPISATANTGYSFTGWVGSGTGSYSGTNNPSSVSMLGPVNETATFGLNTVSVTVRTVPDGYPVMVDDTVYTSPKTFAWSAGSAHTIATDSVHPGDAGTRRVWTSWSDGGNRTHIVAPLTDSVFTASLGTQYYLTMNANPGGTVTPPSGWFLSGASVLITGVPNSGFTFASWSGSGTGSYSGSGNPRTITINGPISQIANFNQNTVLITVQTEPAGRTFRVDNVSYTTVNTFSLLPGSAHTFSTDTIQPGTNGRRYVWTSWSDSGSRSHTFTVPFRDSTVTVTFGTQFELMTISSPLAGGTITPANQSYHNRGDTVSVQAVASAGYAFTAWSGAASGIFNPTSVIMDTAKSVTANFQEAAIVTISSTPPGRTVIVDDASYVAPVNFNWLLNSTHSIGTITPQDGALASRHLWTGWSDTGAITHSVTVDRDTVFDAAFRTQYYLFIGSGGNGSVHPVEGWQDEGSTVEVTATPDSGYGFIEWTGEGPGSYSGFSNPVELTMDGWASQVASFGTILPPPGLAGIANGSVDQPIIPRLHWNRYPGATSYIVQVSTDSLFAPQSNVVDSSGITDTTVQLPVLLNLERYFWRVKARVGPDITAFSETRYFTTIAPTIAVTSPGINWGTTYTYDISWTTQNLSGRVNVLLSTDGGLTFTVIDTNVAGTAARWTVPLTQTPSNFCRVRVVSAVKPEFFGESPNFAIVAGSLPLIVPVSARIPFPAEPTISTFYRLVSSPGVVDTTIQVGTLIPGEHPRDWRLFADNGLPQNYLVELGPASHMETGRGFWLLKRNDLEISANMVMPPLDTNNAIYRIKLRSGWNIIANPFDKSLTWSSILALNGLSPSTELYAYEGSYRTTNILSPFRGYYFFNGVNLTELKISYPFGTSTAAHPAAGRNVDWQLRLEYSSEINTDPDNFIGVAPGATADRDDLDGYKPPIFLDQGFLYFERPEWNPEYSLFSSDFRPEIGEGQTWEFEVFREQGASGSIRFDGLDSVPSQYEVVLVDAYNNTPHDLRKNGTYAFRSVSSRMPFRLLVGSKAYVEREVSAEIPREFGLSQNFPNPFNSTTSISVKLPRDASIRLDVYSVLGQKVATLAEGDYTAGVHTFLWEGTDDRRMPVSSGVYYYRLTEGENLIQVNKMILAK